MCVLAYHSREKYILHDLCFVAALQVCLCCKDIQGIGVLNVGVHGCCAISAVHFLDQGYGQVDKGGKIG